MELIESTDYRTRSSGVAKAGLTTGIIGTSLAGLLWAKGAGNGGLFGNSGGCGAGCATAIGDAGYLAGMNQGLNLGCGFDDRFVSQRESQLSGRVASLEADVALRDASIYSDQKALEMYRYIDGRLREIEQFNAGVDAMIANKVNCAAASLSQQIGALQGAINVQAVENEKTAGNFRMVQKEIDCTKENFNLRLGAETQARCAQGNLLVNYMNATFYPKQVADVTTGTDTTPQALYNPLPCDCDCGTGIPGFC